MITQIGKMNKISSLFMKIMKIWNNKDEVSNKQRLYTFTQTNP
jgi:hypothetical protein